MDIRFNPRAYVRRDWRTNYIEELSISFNPRAYVRRDKLYQLL